MLGYILTGEGMDAPKVQKFTRFKGGFL